MKKVTKYRPRIRSKNHSCNDLRHVNNGLGFYPFKSLIRLGSQTPTQKAFPKSHQEVVEINTVDAIRNSRSKLLMKERFKEAEVPQSEWFIWKEEDVFVNQISNEEINIEKLLEILPNGLIMKKVYGFKGKGMSLIKTLKEWNNFKNSLNI